MLLLSKVYLVVLCFLFVAVLGEDCLDMQDLVFEKREGTELYQGITLPPCELSVRRKSTFRKKTVTFTCSAHAYGTLSADWRNAAGGDRTFSFGKFFNVGGHAAATIEGGSIFKSSKQINGKTAKKGAYIQMRPIACTFFSCPGDKRDELKRWLAQRARDCLSNSASRGAWTFSPKDAICTYDGDDEYINVVTKRRSAPAFTYPAAWLRPDGTCADGDNGQ